jgi:hypothetical protein
MRRIALLLLVTLSLAARASAEDVDAAHAKLAREVALKFLTDGPDAPRPDVTRAQVDAARVVATRGLPKHGRLAAVHVGGCEVMVNRLGMVAEFDHPRGALRVATTFEGKPRTAADIAAETSARCLFTPQQLEARGRAFLARVIPGFAGRNFVVNWSRQVSCLTVAYHDLFLSEERRPERGELAVPTNCVRVQLSSETGKVVMYRGSDFRLTVTAPPPLDADAALRLLLKEEPGLRPETTFLRVVVRDCVPRATWAFNGPDGSWFRGVDAIDGTVFEVED